MTDKREALNLRIPADLKREIESYARRIGITVNAASVVLLRKATGYVD
jgi:antitoxin component of RelBE/YafQ-DinJ toxin-antitoxin module